MKLYQIIIFLLGLVLLSTSLWAQPVPQWAQDNLAEWYAAFNDKDFARLAQLYSKDAVVKTSRGSTLRGRDAIESSFREDFEEADIEVNGLIEGAHMLRDLAVTWGHDISTTTPKGGGEAVTTKTNWLTVYEKQPDGSWLTIRETGSSAEPEGEK
jgi:uncharacterized protein (TIGR02246 family)